MRSWCKKLRAAGAVDHRQDQSVGICVGCDAQLARRTDSESARPHALALGIIRRHRRVDRGGVCDGRTRHRHRRVGARSVAPANGIAGLKTTMGLVSRDGVIPLALSFDTVGPMARSVYDVAAMLSVIAGVDPADAATKAGEGRSARRLHPVAEGGRAQGRAARRRARFLRTG